MAHDIKNVRQKYDQKRFLALFVVDFSSENWSGVGDLNAGQ